MYRKVLAEKIRERRLELGLTQEEMKGIGGPSAETVGTYEAGQIPKNPQARTLELFDSALQWESGSARAILRGEEPRPYDMRSDTAASRRASSPEMVAMPRHLVDDIVRAASKLSVLHRSGADVTDEVAQVHTIATDMLGLSLVTEDDARQFPRLLSTLRNARHNTADT